MQNEKLADLHIHTNFSDGSFSPEKVVQIGLEKGLAAIAITDHDSVGGVIPAVEAAKGNNIEVVAGAELSSYIGEQGIHIVALFIDVQDSALLEHLDFFRNFRHKRGEVIINKLNQLGVKISIDDVLAISGSGSMGRPHIAQALVKIGATTSIKESFDRYLGNGRPAYVPKYKIDPGKAAEIIHSAGGAAILAHPAISTKSDHEIYHIMSMGLDGVEIVHAKHNSHQIQHLTEMARSNRWLMSGGSDCHGDDKEHSDIGECTINLEMFENIRNFYRSRIIKKMDGR